MKIKIPNILTIGRIIIVPFFVLSFFMPGIFGDLVPFFLFILASFTDYLDGLLARLYKEESKLGELSNMFLVFLVCRVLLRKGSPGSGKKLPSLVQNRSQNDKKNNPKNYSFLYRFLLGFNWILVPKIY